MIEEWDSPYDNAAKVYADMMRTEQAERAQSERDRALANLPSEVQASERIASEDLLNPLYESVLKEYQEARSWLERCEQKLVQAVKLTDTDKLREMTTLPPEQPKPNAHDILRRIKERQALESAFNSKGNRL